jgi:phage recombination protein Bet
MSNEITTRTSNLPAALQMDELELIHVLQTSIYPGVQEASIRMAISYCRSQQLDPLQKPVHIVPMWDRNSGGMRDVIMPGVNLYRTQAARSGALAGVTEPEFGPDVVGAVGGAQITYPQWCRVTVRRLMAGGQIAEFTAREFWMENYAVRGGKEKSIAPNAMWTKRPYGQIAKCAQAQALRIAFPEFGGAYTAEEMEGKSLDIADDVIQNEPGHAKVINPESGEITLPPYPHFTKNLKAWQDAIAAGKMTAKACIAKVQSSYSLSEEQIDLINAATVTQ